jgi:hypothetical protein
MAMPMIEDEMPMNPSTADRMIRTAQGRALLLLPSLLILVFVLHFRSFANFLTFHTHYVPRPPADVVPRLIAAANRWPMIHDPHMIAYLALPLFLLCAFGLYRIGREARPLISAIALAITVTGTIYLGGVFGMWTAFYRGLGDVDARYTEGATATFAAMTAPHGAFLLTTTLAKLTMIGIGMQALALWNVRAVPKWSPMAIAAGCALFIAFWDLDNWMLIASVLILAGFIPLHARLRVTAMEPEPRGK